MKKSSKNHEAARQDKPTTKSKGVPPGFTVEDLREIKPRKPKPSDRFPSMREAGMPVEKFRGTDAWLTPFVPLLRAYDWRYLQIATHLGVPGDYVVRRFQGRNEPRAEEKTKIRDLALINAVPSPYDKDLNLQDPEYRLSLAKAAKKGAARA